MKKTEKPKHRYPETYTKSNQTKAKQNKNNQPNKKEANFPVFFWIFFKKNQMNDVNHEELD